MLDTVGVGCDLRGLDVRRLERRGWVPRTTRPARAKCNKKVKPFVTLDNGATFEYFASVGWLAVRASLPKFLGESSDAVLSWADSVRALAVLTGDVICSHK